MMLVLIVPGFLLTGCGNNTVEREHEFLNKAISVNYRDTLAQVEAKMGGTGVRGNTVWQEQSNGQRITWLDYTWYLGERPSSIEIAMRVHFVQNHVDGQIRVALIEIERGWPFNDNIANDVRFSSGQYRGIVYIII